MKRNFLIKVFVSLFIVALCSCSKDEKISEPEKSSECDIVSFGVDGVAWRVSATNVSYTYPVGTAKTTLTPEITVSPGATVSPASGTAHNFFADAGVRYTVTAENGTATKSYTVKASVEISNSCDILSFTVNGVEWDIDVERDSITYAYPLNMVASDFVPVIILSPGARVNPTSGAAQNFFTSSGVTYTVTAENGVTTKTYIVKATISNACEIELFGVDGVEWQINGTNITHSYRRKPATTLTPDITLSPGATVNPPETEPQNFFTAEGVTYTVTAVDGAASKTYTAKATVEKIAYGATGACTWAIIDDAGDQVLTISGNGAMADESPWDIYNHEIVKIVIEAGVTYIGQWSFAGNPDMSAPNQKYEMLTSVTISDLVTTIGNSAFAYSRNMTSLNIGNSVTTIEGWAFFGCSSLASVTIGSSVTTIGESVFSNCNSLTEITNLNPTPQDIGGDVFSGIDISTVTLKVPAGSVDAYKTTAVWGGFNIVSI